MTDQATRPDSDTPALDRPVVIAANRLPEYYHPVFNAPGFTFASGGRFCLLVESADQKFEAGATGKLLKRLGATAVEEVSP